MFDWVLNMALGNTIKKNILKIFPHLRKTFFLLIMHILFCHKNQKNVLQEEIRNCSFEAYPLTKETSS